MQRARESDKSKEKVEEGRQANEKVDISKHRGKDKNIE
jgi:hypothetical protein